MNSRTSNTSDFCPSKNPCKLKARLYRDFGSDKLYWKEIK
jgi:hypothetical protein